MHAQHAATSRNSARRDVTIRSTPKRLLLALACVLACHSQQPASTDQARALPAPVQPTPREVLDAWNLAHVKHDSKALEALYARRVEFYGQSLSAHDCAARKKAAFDKAPDYTQSIRDVHVEASDAGAGSIVTFTKTSTVKGKSADYPSVLVVLGGVITSETDSITDAYLAAQQRKNEMWCVEEPVYPPNDRVIAPYRISAAQAYQRARNSAHFKEQEANAHGDFLDFGQIWCPTGCVHVTAYPDDEPAACGYQMKLENHSELSRRANDTSGFSIMVEWVFIDAIDGTMYWQDGTKEQLPPK